MVSRSHILLITLIVVFFSCRTVRELPVERVKPLAPEKIFKKAKKNTFDYKDLTIRRINCQFSNNDYSTNFRVNLKASKDDKILASISKINIPVGRVLLAADSILYVNYIDKNYFVDDYTFLSKMFNIDIDFITIQSFISNNIFYYANHDGNDVCQTFNSTVDNGKYLIQSVNHRNVFQTKQNINSSLNNENHQSFDNEDFVMKKMVFNPKSFALEEYIIDDKLNNWKLEMAFSDFIKIENKDYPSLINMKIISPDEINTIKIRLNGFSTEELENIDLNIPDSYDQIFVK